MCKRGLVNRIIPFSCVDGPGNRSAVFFQGCGFNCRYCHNPETRKLCISCGDCVRVCPTGALRLEHNLVRWDSSLCCGCDACLKACEHSASPKTRWMSAEDILTELNTSLPFISGITTSGGECTCYDELLVELFKRIHALGKTAFVDTNGQRSFLEMPQLTEEMDKAMLDVKAFDSRQHQLLTGQPADTVLENLNYLAGLNKLYEVRTVIVPGLLNNEETVAEVSRILKDYPAVRYKLIRFRPWGVRPPMDTPVPSDEYMEELKALALVNGAGFVELV